MAKVDCTRCAHYVITWITGTPYGCDAWGIKSSRRPDQVVYAASGVQCQLFSPKCKKADSKQEGIKGRGF
ncbi:MAG: uracil-DNA glycosylase [Syntrophobacteraceae bacterium]